MLIGALAVSTLLSIKNAIWDLLDIGKPDSDLVWGPEFSQGQVGPYIMEDGSELTISDITDSSIYGLGIVNKWQISEEDADRLIWLMLADQPKGWLAFIDNFEYRTQETGGSTVMLENVALVFSPLAKDQNVLDAAELSTWDKITVDFTKGTKFAPAYFEWLGRNVDSDSILSVLEDMWENDNEWCQKFIHNWNAMMYPESQVDGFLQTMGEYNVTRDGSEYIRPGDFTKNYFDKGLQWKRAMQEWTARLYALIRIGGVFTKSEPDTGEWTPPSWMYFDLERGEWMNGALYPQPNPKYPRGSPESDAFYAFMRGES